LLSLVSVGVIVNKQRSFMAATRESQAFKPVFGKFLHGGDVHELLKVMSSTRIPMSRRWSRRASWNTTVCARPEAIRLPRWNSFHSALEDAKAESLIQMKEVWFPGNDWIHGSVHWSLRNGGRYHQRVPEHRSCGVRRYGRRFWRHR
jgi:hypothetical protein